MFVYLNVRKKPMEPLFLVRVSVVVQYLKMCVEIKLFVHILTCFSSHI